MIDAAATKDINIQGGQVDLVSKDNTASAISLTTDIGSSETIVITNTQGTSSSAVDINANAGGVTIDAGSGVSIDAAAASNITLASNSSGDDLSIGVTGANDASLLLSSTGTGADAVSINATAGGIDILASGAAAGEDIDIVATGSSVNISSSEGTSNAIKINASDLIGGIDIDAGAGGVDVDASGAITIGASGVASNFTLSADGDADDLSIGVSGSHDASLLLSSTGTGSDAVSIDASAGSMVIAPSLADGQTLKLGKNGAVEMIISPSGTAANETFSLTNTSGTAENAIAVTSTAGGVDVDAAAGKDIDIAGGQVKLVSKDDAASAISLTTNIGSSETIVVTNTQGTTDGIDDAGAIELSAAAGGIGLAWSDSKDLWAEGGRTVITANENAADAIKLHADAGTSQTINLVNDAGTNAAAIALTSTAGGVTISTASSSATSVNGNLTGTSTNTSANTGAISGFDASLNAATLSSNSYTLVASDNGKVVTIDNNTTAATVVIPTGLGDGFNCLIVQKGNHQTTISPVSGSVTIANRSSETKTAAQYAVISIINIGSETYIVSGDTGS